MKFKGERIQRLDEMMPGKMYVIVHEELSDFRNGGYNQKQQAYAFVFLDKLIHQEEVLNKGKFREITYNCDLINAPDGESEFKLFETIDQTNLNNEESALYSLIQI